MLGVGLERAYRLRNFIRFDNLMTRVKNEGRLGNREIEEFWMLKVDDGKKQKRTNYNWHADEVDRAVNGPFGPAIARYGRPKELEDVLKKLLHSLPSGFHAYPDLRAVTSPLIMRVISPEEREERRARVAELGPMHQAYSRDRPSDWIPGKRTCMGGDFEQTSSADATSSSSVCKRYHPYRPALKKHKLMRQRQCSQSIDA
jgi:hypothetical protein